MSFFQFSHLSSHSFPPLCFFFKIVHCDWNIAHLSHLTSNNTVKVATSSDLDAILFLLKAVLDEKGFIINFLQVTATERQL